MGIGKCVSGEREAHHNQQLLWGIGDYLLKDDIEDDAKIANNEGGKNPKMLAGLIICIAGIVAMILWGLFSILRPEASNQMSESSMITIDGNGIFLILCVVAVVAGAGLLLKSQKK